MKVPLANKIFSMKEAVSRFIEDGDFIAMGSALEAAIPFAVGHEIIRQGKKDLTLIGPISDMLFDQMIGSGCVRRVMAAWVGNVIMGVGYNLRSAVEEGVPRTIEIEDYTNFTISLALHAGALGIPFIPTKSLLGTGMISEGQPFKEMEAVRGNPSRPEGRRTIRLPGDGWRGHFRPLLSTSVGHGFR